MMKVKSEMIEFSNNRFTRSDGSIWGEKTNRCRYAEYLKSHDRQSNVMTYSEWLEDQNQKFRAVEKKLEWIEKNRDHELFKMVANQEAIIKKLCLKVDEISSKLDDVLSKVEAMQ